MWDEDTEFLVVVNHDNEDISWVKRIALPVFVCEGNLLDFIVDYYDNLPKNVINIHDKEYRFYHTGSLVDFINDPSLRDKFKEFQNTGFWNFGTQCLASSKLITGNMKESGWWDACMLGYFGGVDNYYDYVQGRKSYCQFIVSSDRIHSLPKSFYVNMLDWIKKNKLEDAPVEYDPVTKIKKLQPNWENCFSSYNISKYLEYSWELIFSSWKSGDKLTKLPDGRECRAIYGTESKNVDVTHLLVSKFYNNETKKFSIPNNSNWNDLFGDPIFGYPKFLRIIIDGSITEISEKFTVSL